MNNKVAKMTNHKFTYQCTNCGKHYTELQVKYLCPDCNRSNTAILPPVGVLKVIYDYNHLINKGITFKHLKQSSFIDLMPFNNLESLPNLQVGNTPLYKTDNFSNFGFKFNLFLKDDSQNPTYSFKDRASAVVSAYAKEKGYNTIVAASTGNAGSSLAGICAAQGQKAIIIVPKSAPVAKLTQIIMYGATIIPVNGTYDDAFELSMQATEKFGWYNRNTAFNPHTIEGKKTVAFELFEQMNYTVADRIFVPVGDGAIISGVYKGFEELLNLNIINKMPTIVAVQSEKSNNLIRNINEKKFVVVESTTLADSISVDIPRNYYMTQKFIKKYEGECISVSDDEILAASKMLSENTGLFAEPAATAAFAGIIAYNNSNKIPDGSNNIVLLTGSGLKDLKNVSGMLKIPEAISPSIDNIKNVHDDFI